VKKLITNGDRSAQYIAGKHPKNCQLICNSQCPFETKHTYRKSKGDFIFAIES
jgi:hypothetical protein